MARGLQMIAKLNTSFYTKGSNIKRMAASAGASSWSGSSGGSNSSQGRSMATAQPAQEERLVVSTLKGKYDSNSNYFYKHYAPLYF